MHSAILATFSIHFLVAQSYMFHIRVFDRCKAPHSVWRRGQGYRKAAELQEYEFTLAATTTYKITGKDGFHRDALAVVAKLHFVFFVTPHVWSVKLSGEYFLYSGGNDLVEQLLLDEKLSKNKDGKQGVDEMKALLKYCDIYGILDQVRCVFFRQGNICEEPRNWDCLSIEQSFINPWGCLVEREILVGTNGSTKYARASRRRSKLACYSSIATNNNRR